MMPLISQVSRQQFVQQKFSACMRMQGGLPPTMPRVVVRDQRWLLDIERPDVKSLDELTQEVKVKRIKPIKVYEARAMTSTSNVNSPSEIIYISQDELQKVDLMILFKGRLMKFPVGASGKDRYIDGQVKVQMRKPGDRPFSHVKKGAYDIRGLKYLFVITKNGVFIAREMSPAPSERGVVCHPKIAPFAFLGGEVWFLPEEDCMAVHINLNSGRFPAESDEDLHTTAKIWLSLGYDKVYVTPRDQRYGEVTPILFMCEAQSHAKTKANSEVKPYAKPKANSLEFV